MRSNLASSVLLCCVTAANVRGDDVDVSDEAVRQSSTSRSLFFCTRALLSSFLLLTAPRFRVERLQAVVRPARTRQWRRMPPAETPPPFTCAPSLHVAFPLWVVFLFFPLFQNVLTFHFQKGPLRMQCTATRTTQTLPRNSGTSTAPQKTTRCAPTPYSTKPLALSTLTQIRIITR